MTKRYDFQIFVSIYANSEEEAREKLCKKLDKAFPNMIHDFECYYVENEENKK